MQTLSGNQPWSPNTSNSCVSCTAPATVQILFKCPTPAIVFETATKPSCFAHFWQGAQSLVPTTQKCSVSLIFLHFWLRNVLCATTACTFSTCQLPKVLRERQFLTLLTLKCASRRNGVHFFDMSTSESGPNMVCFVHFDLEACFPPQRRALFQHFNFQKCSDIGVFCTFWLRNALRATTACNCSSLIWPDCSAPAALASLLFDHKSLEKHSVSRLSYLFAHLESSFFWLSLLWSSFFFSSLLFSDSSHLCFSSVHIVGSLTSKFPSINK